MNETEISPLWYIDFSNNNEWVLATDLTTVKINECLQELQLWMGESQYYADSGVDYTSLFNGSGDITTQVLNIIESYKEYFLDITVSTTQSDDDILFEIGFIPENLGGTLKITSYNFSYQNLNKESVVNVSF